MAKLRKNVGRRHAWLSGAALVAAGCSAGVANAQDVDSNQPSPAESDEPAGGGIAEIIVTAQKRDQRLQEVPITIQAFTGASLATAGVENLEDLPLLTSGLVLSRTGGGSTPFIRGIGSNDSVAGQESPVATYVDNIYRMSLYSNNVGLKNVERVEVLKGPQGTLFGRNATGGLIHVITKTPSTDTSGEFSVSAGNYQTFEASGYFTGGLAPNLAADLTGYARRQEKGYGTNLLTGGDINLRNETTVASKVHFDDGTTKITLAGDYSTIEDARGFNREIIPGTLHQRGFSNNGNFYDIRANVDPKIDTEVYGGSLTFDHDLGGLNIVSISGYRQDHSDLLFDNDLSPDAVLIASLDFSTKTITQELRVAGGDSEGTNWTAGIYYLYGEAGVGLKQFAGSARAQVADLGGRIKTNSYSAFADLSIKLGNADRLTIGGRYTIDKRNVFGGRSGAISLSPPDPSATWKEPTWRVVLDHKFTDDIMAYASYNRGFKSGNYNLIPPNQPAYNPETVDAFEVGLKSTFWDGRARVNLAAFYNNYKDLQVRIVSSSTTRTINAAKAEIKGFEADITLQPVEVLTITATGTYLDATYDAFANAQQFFPATPGVRCPGASPTSTPPLGGNCAGVTDASGNRLIRSPKFTGNIGANLTVPLDSGRIITTGQIAHTSAFFWDVGNRVRERAFTLVNASLGWESENQSVGVTLRAQNLTKTKYSVYGGSVAETDFMVANTPRTYSVTLDFSF